MHHEEYDGREVLAGDTVGLLWLVAFIWRWQNQHGRARDAVNSAWMGSPPLRYSTEDNKRFEVVRRAVARDHKGLTSLSPSMGKWVIKDMAALEKLATALRRRWVARVK